MSPRRVMLVVAGAALSAAPLAVMAAQAPAAMAVATAGSWGKAIEVPGLGALNTGGEAKVTSVSCPSAGTCAAGGFYTDNVGVHAFVAGERNGRWGKAIKVLGSAALNPNGPAQINSVSCASAGNCAAGGSYVDGSGNTQAFVVSERNGVWGKAVKVPGLGALNAGADAQVSSMSCASAGNCAAGGSYVDGSGNTQAFVAGERNGRWGKAIEVPGSGVLNTGGTVGVTSVSCPSAGNCSAGGNYRDSSLNLQGFVVTERNGVWGKAIEVPGLAALNKGVAELSAGVSCGSAGNCAAGGYYSDGSGHVQAFVAGERNGVWGKAIQVPGLAALNTGGTAFVGSVSCPSAGNCAAGGSYRDAAGHLQVFVASKLKGRWGKATEVPGSGALNKGGTAFVKSVACPSAGNCAAGGSYLGGSGHTEAFVVGERNGVWGKAIAVPGLGALNVGGNAQVNSVSCGSAGNCAAGGSYRDGSGNPQGFVVSQA